MFLEQLRAVGLLLTPKIISILGDMSGSWLDVGRRQQGSRAVLNGVSNELDENRRLPVVFLSIDIYVQRFFKFPGLCALPIFCF